MYGDSTLNRLEHSVILEDIDGERTFTQKAIRTHSISFSGFDRLSTENDLSGFWQENTTHDVKSQFSDESHTDFVSD